jgi:hypothetical protein
LPGAGNIKDWSSGVMGKNWSNGVMGKSNNERKTTGSSKSSVFGT